MERINVSHVEHFWRLSDFDNDFDVSEKRTDCNANSAMQGVTWPESSKKQMTNFLLVWLV